MEGKFKVCATKKIALRVERYSIVMKKLTTRRCRLRLGGRVGCSVMP